MSRRSFFWKILFFVALICAWECLSFCIGQQKLPNPYQTGKTFVLSFISDPIIRAQGGSGYGIPILKTMERFAISILLGLIAGVSLALLVTFARLKVWVINVLVEIFRVIPPLLLVPFLLLITGANEIGIILPSLIYSFFSFFIYSVNALSNLDRQIILFAKQFKPSKIEYYHKVLLPAILPQLLNAFKIVTTITMGIVLVTEYLTSPDGIGSIMKFSSSYSDIQLVIVGILWAILMNFLFANIFTWMFSKKVIWNKL